MNYRHGTVAVTYSYVIWHVRSTGSWIRFRVREFADVASEDTGYFHKTYKVCICMFPGDGDYPNPAHYRTEFDNPADRDNMVEAVKKAMRC